VKDAIMQRFDLISPRQGKDDKTRWTKVGAMFPRDAGGFSLVFDALPLPDASGAVRLLAVEPRQEGAQGAGAPEGGNVSAFPRRAAGGGPRAAGPARDDDIPFGPETR
jgi:hypothetical protein